MEINKNKKRISKRLSLILRHKPELAGLKLTRGGWVKIDDLLIGLAQMGIILNRCDLLEIVETNDKKRFTISEDCQHIRAAQGHSVEVDDALIPSTPPKTLFHGTSRKNLSETFKNGLMPMQKRHVHLSLDRATARKVGARHGKPVVIEVNSGQLHDTGQSFYCADNGVWLTGPISPDYFSEVLEQA